LQPFSEIATNLRHLLAEIDAAAAAAGRPPGSVALVGVAKRQPAAAVRAAAAAGLTDVGENYLQEALGKMAELDDLGLSWHFIGAIQSNKTRAIAEHFHWVHTVARGKVARRLSEQRPEGPPLNVCLQVNVDADPDKDGVAAEEALALARDVARLPRLRLRGLMTILQQGSDPAAGYGRLAELFETLRPEVEALPGADAAPQWDTLSMGMSNDYGAAVRAGATLVRIGTALFGARPS